MSQTAIFPEDAVLTAAASSKNKKPYIDPVLLGKLYQNPYLKTLGDMFCGGGGTTTGVVRVPGVKVLWAINHDPLAIASHAANHPETKHYIENIVTMDISQLEKVDALWASLECTHFSQAKGGQARNADSRMLAEQMYRYIEQCDPNYVFVENVKEFLSWSELIQKKDKDGNLVYKSDGSPFMIPDTDKEKLGTLYKQWVAKIKSMGYAYRYKLLNAADYGAYTSRLRYFGVFAKEGLPIRFPSPTHHKKGAKAGLLPWNAVREKLDFSDKGNSIFTRKKQHSERTLARVYAGLEKFVKEGEENFIHKYYSGRPKGKVNSTSMPLGTITTVDTMGLVQPQINKGRVQEKAFISSYHYNDKGAGLHNPCPTIVTRDKLALVQPKPFILKWNSNNAKTGVNKGSSIDNPLPTITTQNRLGLLQPAYMLNYGIKGLQELDKPAATITCTERMGLIQPAFIMSNYSGGGTHTPLTNPCPAITTVNKHNVVQPFIFEQYGNDSNKSVDQPAGSITCNPKHNLVQPQAEKTPWLMAGQFNNVGQKITNPHPTITSSRHQTYLMRSVVGTPIEIKETDTPMMKLIKEFCFKHNIADIFMRMLRTDELLNIQGFPKDYILKGAEKDKKKFIGNSVCPAIAEALVHANVWLEAEPLLQEAA